MVEEPTVQAKTCSRCHLEKPSTEFDRYKRTTDGLQSQCKACMKVKARMQQPDLNPETMRNCPDRMLRHAAADADSVLTKSVACFCVGSSHTGAGANSGAEDVHQVQAQQSVR